MFQNIFGKFQQSQFLRNMLAYHMLKDVENYFLIEIDGIKRLICLSINPIICVVLFLFKKDEDFLFFNF